MKIYSKKVSEGLFLLVEENTNLAVEQPKTNPKKI